MDINEKFNQFIAETPTKRFHKALNKDGSAKIDKRFKAFRSTEDKVRQDQKTRNVSEEELKDVVESVLDEILQEDAVDEAFRFKTKPVTKVTKTPDSILSKVKEKDLERKKSALLAKAVDAVKKYTANSKSQQYSTEFKATDVHKSYALDRHLGMSYREFIDYYNKINEEVMVNENLRETVKDLVRQRTLAGLSENCGREGEPKVSKKYKKVTPGENGIEEGYDLKKAIEMAKSKLKSDSKGSVTGTIGLFVKDGEYIPGEMRYRAKFEKDGYEWAGVVNGDGSHSLRKGFKEEKQVDSEKEKLQKQIADIKKYKSSFSGNTPSVKMRKVALDRKLSALEAKLTKYLESNVTEAKSATGYEIYHKDFSTAVQHAISQVEKKGYTVDEDEWDRKVALGPKKPSKGKTNSYTIALLKGGKETKRNLQMQVYYDEGRYELNMYIS